MSTLNTTNLKNESSVTNNIVLGADGSVDLDGGVLYVDATNNRVGVGTTSPSYPFHAETTATGTAAGDNTAIYLTSQAGGRDCNIRFQDGLNNTARIGYLSGNLYFYTNGNERTRIDQSGRLLVGTSSARSVSGFGSPVLQLFGDYQQSSALFTNNVNDASSCGLVLSKIRSSSIVQNGDPLGYISFNGYDGATDRAGAYIQANIDGTPGSGDLPTRLVFSTTADSASSPTERMRISNTGALGLSGANYGSSGQVLTSQGSGSAPQWADAGGGAWNLISSVTASNSSSVAFTSGINGTYDVYAVIIEGAVPVVTDALFFRTSSNGGSSYDSGASDYNEYNYGTRSNLVILQDITNTSAGGGSARVFIFNSQNSSKYTSLMIQNNRWYSNSSYSTTLAGVRLSTTNINAIQFYFNNTNISTGNFRLYGISNS